MRHAICYVSDVDPEMRTKEINELLKYSQKKNRERDIKGVLLFSDGNFFQVLEGRKEQILKLWQTIEKDPRHRNIIKILDRDIEKGSFDSYKAEILEEENKFKMGIPAEYAETLIGMPKDVKRIIEGMLGNFIMTRP